MDQWQLVGNGFSSGAYSDFYVRNMVATNAVPEIDPAGIGSILAVVVGALGLLERRRLKAV